MPSQTILASSNKKSLGQTKGLANQNDCMQGPNPMAGNVLSAGSSTHLTSSVRGYTVAYMHNYASIHMTPKQAAKCCNPVDDLLDPALFKALGDPTRLKLLACLAKCGRACSVTEVAECCSVDFSVVSRHLAALEKAGVLQSVKNGRVVSYTVRYQELSRTLHDLANAVCACCPDGKTASRKGESSGKR
jgi:ArsR family transcriptional regulator, arsenate/arsenite/antimonite-responsive transcriptional repressor